MSFAVQTPQRPVPGAFLATPATTRHSNAGLPVPGSLVTRNSFTGQQQSSSSGSTALQPTPFNAPKPQAEQAVAPVQTETLPPIQRAARTVNETLSQEARHPELDSYVGQGISAEYDISKWTSPWSAFQRTKIYDIPEKIFEQYNQAQMSTMMGLMAEINHAWISIDNALYLWDYTHPNPELIGYEDQPNTITAVKLVVPRKGVFIASVRYMLVVATTAEMILIGVSNSADGGIVLYQTSMAVSIRGLDVNVIQGSAATGRIFFGSRSDDDVYELTYNSQEKWFTSQCAKINHTTKGLAALAPNFSFTPKAVEYIEQMVVDDSRNLLYTLSSSSTIKTFHMKGANGLDLAITQPFSRTYMNLRHMLSSTPLIDMNTKIVSISTISSREAAKLHLVAITSTGCRLFMSATSSMGWSMSESVSAPTSMQVQHVKFPPPTSDEPAAPRQSSSNFQSAPLVDTRSNSLTPTRFAVRYAPGYFLDLTPSDTVDRLFLSSPDSGRIAAPQDASQVARYYETGLWLDLESRAEDIGLISPEFSASASPVGFGNEPATQFDKSAVEVAVLTNTGVHVLRRKRLVDVFANVIKQSSGEEAVDAEVKKFIRLYGRGETASSALAVACGQGFDFGSDGRNTKINDPDLLDAARKVFINYGGKPTFNENSVLDQTVPAIDNVRPSPRHDGLALYIARLVRSIWKMPIVREAASPTTGVTYLSTVPAAKLTSVQQELTKLQDFLSSNQSFIDGLAGPDALQRVSNKQEEVALQAEHRALHSLVLLISDIIEGISFVLTLFEERVDEIILSLPEASRPHIKNLTYESLFSTTSGKDLAKELVKAIVNRNIARGSNVDTIADSLRRRCGSFCSPDDAVVFKAQELLKRASEQGGTSDTSRGLLRESLRLFEQVAGNLSPENLQLALGQFSQMQFYAGAIQLALKVAKDTDPSNKALAYITEGRQETDPRKSAYDARNECYSLIFKIITAVDKAASESPTLIDGQLSQITKLKAEAYEVVYESTDEVFQYALYDWYLSQGWTDRLLEVNSPYVVGYLKRRFSEGPNYADLLWRYHATRGNFYEAAAVQLQLIRSDFEITLEKRIEYLSQAKAMAQSYTPGVGRQRVQVLLHEISDLLDVANIQDDVLQRIGGDPRVSAEQKEKIKRDLNGAIIDLSELFNTYCDAAGYYDICILIYQAADYRSPSDIKATWQNLIEQIHLATEEKGEPQPYEAVSEKVRSMGQRLNLSQSTFPVGTLLPMLEKYAFEQQRDVGPTSWVVDTFLDIGTPYEAIIPVLEGMFYNDEAPFQGRNRRFLARDIIHVLQIWYRTSSRNGGVPFGSDANAKHASQMLGVLQQVGLEGKDAELCRLLRLKIESSLR